MLEGCNLSHPGSTITIDPQPGKAMCGEKKNYMDDQQLRDNYTQQDDQNKWFKKMQVKSQKKGRDSLEIKHFGWC